MFEIENKVLSKQIKPEHDSFLDALESKDLESFHFDVMTNQNEENIHINKNKNNNEKYTYIEKKKSCIVVRGSYCVEEERFGYF